MMSSQAVGKQLELELSSPLDYRPDVGHAESSLYETHLHTSWL